MTLIQRRLNVDATSWRSIDVEPTLYKRHVPAGITYRCIVQFVYVFYNMLYNSHSLKGRLLSTIVFDFYFTLL